MAGGVIGDGIMAETELAHFLHAKTAEFLDIFIKESRARLPPTHVLVMNETEQAMSGASIAFQAMIFWCLTDIGASPEHIAYAIGIATGFVSNGPNATPAGVLAEEFFHGINHGRQMGTT